MSLILIHVEHFLQMPLFLTVSGLRVSHSCLQSFFAYLRPITLHPAPVSTSQSICLISESFDLYMHAGRMCSEFLSLSQQTSIVSVYIIFTEVWGMFASFLDMKNGGGWADILCMVVMRRVRFLDCEHLCLVTVAFGVGSAVPVDFESLSSDRTLVLACWCLSHFGFWTSCFVVIAVFLH